MYIQVEWDEPGCGDKQNRVNPWEIETPESLFIFPSLTAGLKRPFQPTLFGEFITVFSCQLPTVLGNKP